LVGCDVESTYQAESRDTTTWGFHLLELSDQGMKLDHTIADGGKGLRSDQKKKHGLMFPVGEMFSIHFMILVKW
jgi:hypothetical protein